jgi:hypothetical protein
VPGLPAQVSIDAAGSTFLQMTSLTTGRHVFVTTHSRIESDAESGAEVVEELVAGCDASDATLGAGGWRSAWLPEVPVAQATMREKANVAARQRGMKDLLPLASQTRCSIRDTWSAETGLKWPELLARLRATGKAMPIKDSLIAATA